MSGKHTMKIVINRCKGAFCLSPEALAIYNDKKGYRMTHGSMPDCSEARIDPVLVAIVDLLGPKASGPNSNLGIVNIPDDLDWEVFNHCGWEWVAAANSTWPPLQMVASKALAQQE